MSRKKRKKQSSAIVSCKKGLACLGLICAVQMLPQTVLADDSAVQVNPADSAVQVNPADSAVQVNPADSAAQMNPADFVQQADPVRSVAQDNSAVSAEADERLPGDQKEETVEGVPADDAASSEGENTQKSAQESLGSDANADAGAAASDDAESFEDESMQNSARVAPGSDVNVDAGAAAADDVKSYESEDVQDSVREAPEKNVNVNPAAPDEAVTGGDQMTADAETEKAEAPMPALVSAGDSPTAAGELPSKFDLRDLGVVTLVKSQYPWGTCGPFLRQRPRSHLSLPKWARPTRRQVSTSLSVTLPGM